MRIALIYDVVYPFVIGGAERRNYALARSLGRSHDVSLYSFDWWSKDPGRCLSGCRYVSVGPAVPLYDRRGRRRIFEAIFFALCLFRALLTSREEVWDVTSFPYFSVPVAWLIALIRRRKLVVTWHEYWGDYWYQYLGWKGFLGKIIENIALWCSPRILTGSRHAEKRLLAAGVSPDRITVIPHGVDLEKIAAVAPALETSDLICISRLIPHKRVDLAIRALKELHRTAPETTLNIIGEGTEKERLVSLVRELGLEGHVRFLGSLPSDEAVYARLKASRVLVFPSRREGFGLAAIEAWACGIPVVVCDESESALPELIERDLLGRVVASEPAAIALACQELLSQDSSVLAEARVEVAAQYDWERIAERVLAVYQEVLSSPCGHPRKPTRCNGWACRTNPLGVLDHEHGRASR